MKMNKCIFAFLYVHMVLILLCLILAYGGFCYELPVAFFLNFSVFLYVWIFYSTHKIGYQFSHPYYLLLYSFLGFILWNNVTTFLGLTDYWNGYFSLGETYFGNSIVHIKTYILVILAMLFAHLAAIISAFLRGTSLFQTSINYKSDKVAFFQQKCSILFWVFLPFYVLYVAYLVYYVISQGYMALFGDDQLRVPAFLGLSDDFTRTFFWVYMLTRPTFKKAKPILIAYIILLSFSLLKGGRGAVFCELLAIISLFEYLGKRVNFKRICVVGCLIMILSPIVFYFRIGKDMNEQDESIVQAVISQQGVSVVTISTAITFEHKLPKSGLNYIVGPFIDFGDYLKDRLLNEKQSFSDPEKLPKLSQIMSYLVDRNAFIAGWGLGSSFIAEFYILGGIFGVCFFSYLSIMFVMILFHHQKSFCFLFFAYISIGSMIFSIRDNPLSIFISAAFPLVIYFLLCLFYYVSKFKK